MSETNDVGCIAIVGMAGRFPGAANLDEFWANLRGGVESIRFFEESAAAVDAAARPRVVRAAGALDDIDTFAADFFGIPPREAELMDPQHRLFLESAWEAIESAGYDASSYEGRIGVYVGTGPSDYLLKNIALAPFLVDSAGEFPIMLGNDPAFLATRVSYKLDLKGPSMYVGTACSSSLVAVQLATQALTNFQCDMALAGGVRITVTPERGYVFQEGGILSPDGHCRAFDAQTRGTVPGSGLGVVLLKRLEEAIADGDIILAVIRGAAVNNDGAQKAGYTAPSVTAQSEVIAEAQAAAGVHPEQISYIEAHGTGTRLGDPIEIEALTRAFRAGTSRRGYCAIGSLKTNIGHLDAAAGVAGLIKVVLSLRHGLLPASLHFESPNPEIDFASSPFYVNAALSTWDAGGTPRRAGVSSFGIGGTNAHVVLEEAPVRPPPGPSRAWQLLVLSAQTITALDSATSNLADCLKRSSTLNLADVAFTLGVARKAFAHRRAIVCRDPAEAVSALETLDPRFVVGTGAIPGKSTAAFVFSGQGSQYPNMTRELYEHEPAFRSHVDRSAEILERHVGFDIRRLLFPDPAHAEQVARDLSRTDIAQVALFVTEHALARTLMDWGIRPHAMIGYSIGEYVAACLAGVMTLEDALQLVAARGRLMQALPGGSMLSVQLPEPEARAALGDVLCLASVVGPSQCVLAGETSAIEALRTRLVADGVGCMLLGTSHAFHSQAMDPILDSFTELVAGVKLQPPELPYISNVSGQWITAAEATSPRYWAVHLRQTVRFAQGIETLLGDQQRVLLEVGPGRTLAPWQARQERRDGPSRIAFSVRRPKMADSDVAFLLAAVGSLWLAGVPVDWKGVFAGEQRQRCPLPTYPFERRRYWVEPETQSPAVLAKQPAPGLKADPSRWLYAPLWRQTTSAPPRDAEEASGGARFWLIFTGEHGIGEEVVARLRKAGDEVISVKPAARFAKLAAHDYAIDPLRRGDYENLLDESWFAAKARRSIVHFGALADRARRDGDRAGTATFHELILLAQALGEKTEFVPLGQLEGDETLPIMVVSSGLHPVTGEERSRPDDATLLGPVRVIGQEYPNVLCRNIDIDSGDATGASSERCIGEILAELNAPSAEQVVAYRGGRRWIQGFEHLDIDVSGGAPALLRERGVYLITGGLGGVGLALAEYLARTVEAKLVLIGRSNFPAEERWDEVLASDGKDQERVRTRIRALRELKASGAEVLVVRADVADEDAMRSARRLAHERFTTVHGVIHAAGIPPEGIIQLKTPEGAERVLASKVDGGRVLEAVFGGDALDFIVLCSSIRSFIGVPGSVDYCAANAALNALALRLRAIHRQTAISIAWDGWRDVGMGLNAPDVSRHLPADLAEGGMTSAEGVEVFRHILANPRPQIVVSTRDLDALIRRSRVASAAAGLAVQPDAKRARQDRPKLKSAYVAPTSEIERTLLGILAELLGFSEVGIHDNFFELGADSLTFVQMGVKMNERGLHLNPRRMFELHSVAELAAALEGVAPHAPEAEPKADAGPVPLTPIQHWFFEQELSEPHRYNQTVVLNAPADLVVEHLEKAVKHILDHHDVFRLHFERREAGWAQWQIQDAEPVGIERIDLSKIPSDALGAAIGSAAVGLQDGFDLARGLLVHVGVLDLGAERGSRLLFVVHHLIMDAISFRILVQDLERAYRRIERGEPVDLPPRTASFRRWSKHLNELGRSGAFQGELSYWLSERRAGISSALGTLRGPQAAGVTSTRTLSLTLHEDETRALLEVARRHRVTMNDACLAALGLSLVALTKEPVQVIDLEGIGRDIVDGEEIDVSHTVGWFTAIFPALLDLGGVSGPLDALVATTAQLRQVPRNGIGYGILRYLSADRPAAERLRAMPQAVVSFVYHGQVDAERRGPAPFHVARELAGPIHDSRAQPSHPLAIAAGLFGGGLRIDWTFRHPAIRAEAVEALCDHCGISLRALAAEQGQPEPDSPGVALSQQELDAIAGQIGVIDVDDA